MARNKPPTAASEEDDYRAKSDASTLADAAEIQGDPVRHAKAKVHLDNKATAATSASANAEQVQAQHDNDADDEDINTAPATKPKRKPSLREKVKVGLKKAFPSN